MTTEQPLILNLAPTGMTPTRERSAHVPLQPQEIVKDVIDCTRRGISMVHIHAREDDDQPSHKKDIYARIISGIREQAPELVICVSCSGRVENSFERRAEVLELEGDLKPDMASLTLSSLNFPTGASLNAPKMVVDLATAMQDRGIVPEIEVFDLGMVHVLNRLAETGKLRPPFYVNILLGNLATAQARFLDIGAIVSSLPPGTVYSLAGLGASQLPVAAMAVGQAPGVRIGLEDNLWYDSGRTIPATNLGLVEKVHQLADVLNRPILSPSALRKTLALTRA